MADRDLKAMTADIDTPVFDTTAFTTPSALADATVAIVTTASLHHPDQDDFAPNDTGFRVLDGVTPRLHDRPLEPELRRHRVRLRPERGVPDRPARRAGRRRHDRRGRPTAPVVCGQPVRPQRGALRQRARPAPSCCADHGVDVVLLTPV